jgi:predicted site-specific integrase-resolvase
VHENAGYRTFVRVRYDEAQANRILASEIKRNQALYARFKASKSFNELEAEVQQIDTRKSEEIRAITGE